MCGICSSLARSIRHNGPPPLMSESTHSTIPFSTENAALQLTDGVVESSAPLRILISRTSGIGNAILTLPVACCLRDHFPDAYIGWVVESEAAPIVRGHESIDHVTELPRRWFKSLSGIRVVRQRLLEQRFDIAIDCQGDTRSALAGYLSGAARRIGYSGKHSMGLSGWLNNEPVAPVFHHVADRALELLTPLGIHHPAVRWALPINVQDQKWADAYRGQMNASRVAILNPGGSWPSKLWESDRFSSTARYLADRYGYHSLVIWGTFEERLMAEQIVELSEGTASLAPDTSLATLAALIRSCDLFVSGDTGPLHMAVAVGTRTIGLYGATRPKDSGPYDQVALQMDCESGSRRRRRTANNRAMRAIGVEHVCAVIDDLHSRPSVRAA